SGGLQPRKLGGPQQRKSCIFRAQPPEDFARNVAVIPRWFPAPLAERIRERRPLSPSAVMTIIEACRSVISSPTFDASRGDLLRAAFEVSMLDTDLADSLA